MLTGNIIVNLVSEIEVVKQKNLNSQGADIKNPSIENLDIKDLNFKDLNFEKMIKIKKLQGLYLMRVEPVEELFYGKNHFKDLIRIKFLGMDLKQIDISFK